MAAAAAPSIRHATEIISSEYAWTAPEFGLTTQL
jgi:hypothetical protein